MSSMAEAPEAPEVVSEKEAFVILHTGLGLWTRGDVIKSGDLPPSEIHRHLSLKSIRLAYPAEARMKHVDLPDEMKDVSFNQKLAEKDQQIMSLQATIREQADALSRSNPHLAVTFDAERQANSALIREKDQSFSDLNERYKALDLRHQALERKNRDVEQELADVKHKLSLMESSSATPTREEIQARINALSGQAPSPPAGVAGAALTTVQGLASDSGPAGAEARRPRK